MIEKMRVVSNPLTIIAIFAALAEVAGTVVLGLVDISIQRIFVWFVMFFPILIVLLFFTTLNFNPKVLYAPSDFKDEANFIQTMLGAKKIEDALARIDQKVEAAELQIEKLNHAEQRVLDGDQKTKAISEILSSMKQEIQATRETAEDLKVLGFVKLPHSVNQAQIIRALSVNGKASTIKEISELTELDEQVTARALANLGRRGVVTKALDGSGYRLA